MLPPAPSPDVVRSSIVETHTQRPRCRISQRLPLHFHGTVGRCGTTAAGTGHKASKPRHVHGLLAAVCVDRGPGRMAVAVMEKAGPMKNHDLYTDSSVTLAQFACRYSEIATIWQVGRWRFISSSVECKLHLFSRSTTAVISSPWKSHRNLADDGHLHSRRVGVPSAHSTQTSSLARAQRTFTQPPTAKHLSTLLALKLVISSFLPYSLGHHPSRSRLYTQRPGPPHPLPRRSAITTGQLCCRKSAVARPPTGHLCCNCASLP
jgi:hypothetical protein